MVFDEPHVTCRVRSRVDPSEKLPRAAYWSWVKRAIEAFAGCTVIDVRFAFDTVRLVMPVTPPARAVTTVMPGESALASPWLPGAFDTVATLVFDDAQLAADVRFCFDPSENVPVAVSWSCVPRAMVWMAGVMAVDERPTGPCSCSRWP